MENIKNPNIVDVDNIINDFIEGISSIKEVFHENQLLIRKLGQNANIEMNDFIESLARDKEGKLILPADKQSRAKKVMQRKNRVVKAMEIVPPSSVVSMVSQFDTLIGGLIRAIHIIQPNKFKALGTSLTMSDILEYDDIDAIKGKVIEDKVESILRMSHEEQLGELEKMLDKVPLTKFEYYNDFIEITQRRNLFVHSNGKISAQYYNKCLKSQPENKLKAGDQLDVDGRYFDKAYVVLFRS